MEGGGVIEVSLEKCTGCGRCVEVCPAGAVRIADGHAVIDDEACRRCEACVEACPQGALRRIAAPLVTGEAAPLQARPPAVIDVAPVRTIEPRRQRILPALASAVAFVGREVLPPVLEFLAAKREDANAARPDAGQADSGQADVGRAPGHRRRLRRGGR